MLQYVKIGTFQMSCHLGRQCILKGKCLMNFAKDDYTSKYFNLRAKLRCFLHYGYRHQSSFGHRRLSHFINITSGWINLLAGQRTWCSNSENSAEYALLEATCLGCFVDHEVSDQQRSSEMKSSRYSY